MFLSASLLALTSDCGSLVSSEPREEPCFPELNPDEMEFASMDFLGGVLEHKMMLVLGALPGKAPLFLFSHLFIAYFCNLIKI